MSGRQRRADVRGETRGRPIGAHRNLIATACAMTLIAAPSPGEDVPDVLEVLERAIAYATRYGASFRPVIAEEYYEQTVWTRALPRQWRKLESDFIMLYVPEDDRWLGFRDVREVDGHALRDRSRRLEKLLTGPREMGRLRDEAARYNIGSVERNVNVPTLALQYLDRGAWHRSEWEVQGIEEIEGARVVQLGFEERARPTLVRSLSVRSDVPAEGTFWVDPHEGTVIRSRLILHEATGAQGDITVTYRLDPGLSMWLPAEMEELYLPHSRDRPFDSIRCRATYSSYVSAEVQTEELGVRLPPGEQAPSPPIP
jgi:hypothetical protein